PRKVIRRVVRSLPYELEALRIGDELAAEVRAHPLRPVFDMNTLSGLRHRALRWWQTYSGGEYGSGVPVSIRGYLFRLSENSWTIFVTGATTQELYQGKPSRSSFRSVRRLMTFGSGSVNGASYIRSCQMKWTFQFRHLTADNRSAT